MEGGDNPSQPGPGHNRKPLDDIVGEKSPHRGMSIGTSVSVLVPVDRERKRARDVHDHAIVSTTLRRFKQHALFQTPSNQEYDHACERQKEILDGVLDAYFYVRTPTRIVVRSCSSSSTIFNSTCRSASMHPCAFAMSLLTATE